MFEILVLKVSLITLLVLECFYNVTRVNADKTVALAGITSYVEVLSIWTIFAVELTSSEANFANILHCTIFTN